MSPLTVDAARLPVALCPLVEPVARALTLAAVTSPPKRENELTELEAVERAFAPTSVFAETEIGPVVTTEPSPG
ncbi:MAG: hypothetical protein E6G21_09270 [Actinobacteria bacterium]|nr:MAG: hypothetical protein E6G21_09270 [Actinomycetota bacterium]